MTQSSTTTDERTAAASADAHHDLDPRVARSRAAIVDATIELLAEEGFANTTIEGIARRAGVAKTTVYRHWDDRRALLLDALGSLFEPTPVPDLGDLRSDLISAMTDLLEGFRSSTWSRLLPAMVDARERDPDYDGIHERLAQQRRAPLREVLERAVADGLVRDSVDVADVVATLAGSVLYRRLVLRSALDDDTLAERTVELVLDGLLARPRSAP
ncbi:MAG: TetR/AcrR family transcriptional regulator [Acidimicrobiales bacterium]|nr:TetR/AcrR family transcriptional regulator [Acidimicrobiales bacterium]